MRIIFALVIVLICSAVFAAENQAFLGIFAETQVQKMIGMPEMADMPDMSAMAGMPGMGNFQMPGMPSRLLNVRLWSPSIAPKDAFATLGVPQGLKQGPKLNLELYRPQPGKVEGGGIDGVKDMEKFTIKRYWGSSATVKQGQPQVITWKGLTPEQQQAMRESAQQANAKSSYYYKPDWTTGYWPTKKQPGRIAMDASLLGKFSLTTNYTGNVEIDVPKTVEFLAPIELSSPKLDKYPPLDKPIVFHWKAVPGILGYHASIIGMQGKDTMIIWTSSEIETDMAVEWDYLQMAQVREFVRTTAMMAPDRVEVTVPASIFKDCDFVYFRMTGYGPGAALAEAQPLPRVQTKTTLGMMLGGKEMKEMKFGGE